MPYACVWAQSDGALKLLKLPKVALVLGNSKYKEAPLRNPANDASAIAGTLKACGFDVTLKVDAGKSDMAAAIQTYVQTLATKKCVGAFYYAGHGIQLAWRNYMVPVDANIDSIEDVQMHGVDVGDLLRGLTQAANPMNVIILDACRDNPFGSLKGASQRGLAQMDAPPNTLLAFATAPGNVASDGEGANGLYTENLLRQMTVPDAKIEDVFKRVRLGVRLASKGAQIPWESTSLEEDFYFVPPEELRKRSQEEEEREFMEEAALFEKARQSKEPAPIENYMRRYPSGRFAELAQLRLDQVLAAQGEKPIEIVPSKGNPFTAGTVRADTKFKVGDRWTYDEFDNTLFGKKPERFTVEVTAITEAHVILNDGQAIRDLLGNQVRLRNGREMTPRQDQPLEYAVGKKWSTRYAISRGGKLLGRVDMEFKVAARETITVPAGTFDCFRIEASGTSRLRGRPDEALVLTRWDAPDRLRSGVARDEIRRRVVKGHVETLRSQRLELVSFEQG
jgi:hypothetical protein